MNESIRLFLYVFCGAFVGAFTGLHYFYNWWSGAIIGGLIGGCYKFKEIVNAMPKAWKTTKRDVPVWVREAWVEEIRPFGSLFFFVLQMLSFLVSCLICYDRFSTGSLRNSLSFSFGLVVIFSLVLTTAIASLSFFGACQIADKNRKGIMDYFLFFNPVTALVSAPICVVYMVICLIWSLIKSAHTLTGLPSFFLRNLAELVRDEMRPMAVVFGAVGAVIGYFMNSPIIGALLSAFVAVGLSFLARAILHFLPKGIQVR